MVNQNDLDEMDFLRKTIQSGKRMDLTVLTEQDILAYADTVAGWGRYGAIVGDVDQIRRCKTGDDK